MIRQRLASFSLFLLLISACSQVDPGPSPIVEGPAIVDFSASPLNASGSATLSWRVNDATSISIDQGVGDVTGQSSFTVTPQGTTTYTLTATNSEGTNSARVTVTVSGTSPNPGPGNDTAAPTGSFGVSQDANPPFQNDSGDNIEGEGDSRIVRVAPGGTFYAQVAYEDASGITDIAVNLVNGSPGGVRGTLDPRQQFFTLGEVTGTCDLSSSPVSVTCVYPITVAEDAVNIDKLDGSGGEFAYVFRTQVTDAAGNTSDEAIRGYVIVTEETDVPEAPNNRAPSADFTSEQQEDSLTVKFSAQNSSDPDGDSLSYAWDFGDDSTGSSRDFTKNYREAGDYEVTLTVSDGQGGEAMETKTVMVEPVQTTPDENTAPQVEIEEVDPITLTDDSVSASLEATVTDPDSDTFTYTWNVTEGNAENVTLASRNEEDTDVSFSAAGSYALTLTVSDGDKEGKGSVTVEVKAGDSEGDDGEEADQVEVPDERLESLIRNEINKPEGALTRQDLERVKTIAFEAKGLPTEDTIQSLEGLQFAINLEVLDVPFNDFEDLTPLVDNPGLGEGDRLNLVMTPLETCPGTEDRNAIDTLLERGVKVLFDDPNGCDVDDGDDSDNNDGTLTVTSTSGAASLEDECTLRAAITAANTDQAVGGCPAGNGADTIVLANETYTLSETDNDTDGLNGLPSITSEITLQGNGATVRRAGEQSVPDIRLLHISSQGELEVQNVTFREGVGESVSAIYNAGTLSLIESTITANGDRFVRSVAIYNEGALRMESSTVSESLTDGISNSGTAEIVKSTVQGSGNSDEDGLGIDNSGTLTLVESTVSRNSGGGIVNSGTADIDKSTIEGNGLFVDGIINTEGGALSIVRSLVKDNGYYGIDNSGTLSLVSSTVADNYFIGVNNEPMGQASVTFSTVVDNAIESFVGSISNDADASAVTVFGTILDTNFDFDCVPGGNLTSLGYNYFINDEPCSFDQETDIVNESSPNNRLQDNGGPTLTTALKEGSAAIDHIPAEVCEVETDQRGVPRPQGEACDIGAFELEQ